VHWRKPARERRRKPLPALNADGRRTTGLTVLVKGIGDRGRAVVATVDGLSAHNSLYLSLFNPEFAYVLNLRRIHLPLIAAALPPFV